MSAACFDVSACEAHPVLSVRLTSGFVHYLFIYFSYPSLMVMTKLIGHNFSSKE